MDEHDWTRDSERRDEGLVCGNCGMTEAEAEALPQMAARCRSRATTPRLGAATEYLSSLPLEERVPGYGHAGLSEWDKAELLAFLDNEES